MRTFTAIVVLFVFCPSIAMSNDWRDLNTYVNYYEYDTALHLFTGGIGSGLIGSVLPEDTPEWKRWIGTTLLVLLGATIKETTDKNFYWKDVGEYGIGALAGNAFTIEW